MRTYSVEDVAQATDEHKKMLTAFHPETWLADERNVALINESNDVSLFQRMLPNVVIGHYFYHSRGKNALKAAREMLDEIFSGPYNVEVLQGLSPLEKLGARWLNRKLGFKSYGVVDTPAGPCEMVIMTKQEWRQLNG